MYPVDSVPLVSSLVIWACLLQCWSVSVGYQCAPCTNCTLPNDCTGGFTHDVCGCCQVCAKVENQTCGGSFSILGKCDEGLDCVRDISVGSEIISRSIANNEEGICKTPINARTVSTSSPCATVKCPVALPCANDSYRMAGDTPQGECCPRPGSCSCNICEIHKPECPLGKLLRMVRRGENIPGRCCDIYECLEKEIACINVVCEADRLAEVKCPDDSYPLPVLLTQNGCCYIHQGCECLRVTCRQLSCPLGTLVKVVSPGIGKPGFCCDELVCEPDNTTTCMHNDRLRMNGETWDGGNCTQCECKGGLTLCRRTQCAETLECGWATTPPGECCPVCQGCRTEDETFHQEGLIWMEDECTMCRCMQGQIFCKTQLCDVHCLRPKKQAGECCASCDDDDSRIPDHCPNQLLSNCSIHCPNGLLTDDKGCPTCECKPSCELHCPFGYMTDFEGNDLCECRRRNYCPPLINCQKRCRHGYKLGTNGCQVCQCLKCPDLSMCWIKCPSGLVIDQQGCTICQCKAVSGVTEGAAMTSTTPSGAMCMSTGGRSHQAGDTWFDGCRLCSCFRGQEMCSLITCSIPRCSQPLLKAGDCCHSCPGETMQPLPTGSPRCPAGGDTSKQNELWQLDSCTRCLCHGAAILCEEERCPPLPCRHLVKTPGMCCPQCADDNSVIPSPGLIPGRGCKSLAGVNYSDGEVWRTNPCQSCACVNGQVHCFSQTCPILSCNETIIRKGQCCPVCQTGDHGVCVQEGKIYTSGQHWTLDECYHCMCLRGEKHCVQLHCDSYSPSQCDHLIKIPGQCCSVCLNGSSTIPPVIDKTTAHSSGTGPPVVSGSGLQALVAVLVTLLVLLLIIVAILVAVVLLQRRRRQHERRLYENPQNIMDNREKAPMPYSVVQTLPLFQNINKQNLDNEKYELCDEKSKLHDESGDSQFNSMEKKRILDSESDHTGSTETKKTDIMLNDSVENTFTEPAHCDSDNPDSTKSLLRRLEEVDEHCREPATHQRYSMEPEAHGLLDDDGSATRKSI